MPTHVIKYSRDDNKELKIHILWCGYKPMFKDFYFENAGHLSLSVGGSIQPCKNCIKAIIKELQKEL